MECDDICDIFEVDVIGQISQRQEPACGGRLVYLALVSDLRQGGNWNRAYQLTGAVAKDPHS